MPLNTVMDPPFPRGTYQPYSSLPGEVKANAPFTLVLGQEWEFEDILWNTGGNGPPDRRSGSRVRCRLVKNDSGSALTPQYVTAIDPLKPGSATGAVGAVNLEAYPVDEFLPAAGVPADGVFWVVVRGMALITMAASITADITAGDFLNPSVVTAGTLDIINSFTANKALFQNIIGARFKATASLTASGHGGNTLLVEVFS
jgi:hypothetical protein